MNKRFYRNWLCATLLLSMPMTTFAAEYQLDDFVVSGNRIHEAPITEHNEVPGGQVARTADYGILGNRDTMTHHLMRPHLRIRRLMIFKQAMLQM